MAEEVDELTCQWEDEKGIVITKQLDRVILTRGAWATILYAYQDLNRAQGDYGKPKFRIQRYQKRGGQYRPHSKFNISSVGQASQIAEVLMSWVDRYGG